MDKCTECRKEFDPFDDEHREHAVKILVPRTNYDSWRDLFITKWGNPLDDEVAVFCGSPCLHQFSNPDTP